MATSLPSGRHNGILSSTFVGSAVGVGVVEDEYEKRTAKKTTSAEAKVAADCEESTSRCKGVSAGGSST